MTLRALCVAIVLGGSEIWASQPIAQTPAPRPSFVCAKATDRIEQTTCSDTELEAPRMGHAYRQRYSALSPNERGPLLEDRGWRIASRASQCNQSDAAARACIRQITKPHLATLDQKVRQPLQLVARPGQTRARATPARILAVPIFAAFGYAKMPDDKQFKALGIKRIYCIDRNLASTGPPDKASVRSDVARFTALDPEPIVCIDIELQQYPYDIRTASKTAVDATVAYLSQIIGWVRSANPKAKVGIYGIFPMDSYWVPNQWHAALHKADNAWWRPQIPAFQRNYQAWVDANTYLAPLAQEIDYLFPSLYTYYSHDTESANDIQNGWQSEAFAVIAEAKKLGKPIYPFLWPQFHDTGTYHDFRYIPNFDWQEELRFVRYYADGVVIWGTGGYLHEDWNPNAPWWQSVLDLANSLANKGTPGGRIGTIAIPFEYVYSGAQNVMLVADGSSPIRYTLDGTSPTCTTGTLYSSPISITKTTIINTVACYANGSSVTASFAYVIGFVP
jgi:uncharacterized protein